MKVFLLTSLMAATFLFNNVHAQPPAPGPGPVPRPGPMMPPPPAAQLQEVSTFSGKVARLSANDDYVYDGFYMINNNDSLLVRFPPHMGAQLTKSASVGSTVTVSGVQEISPEGRRELHMIKLNAGGKTFTDTPPAELSTPPAEEAVEGTGKISALQTGPMGEIKGLLLDGKTILRIPPHVAAQLAALLQTGSSVGYTGNKRAAASGEAMSGNYSIVHATTLTVNGKQYLTR
ncbi:MAG: hypothetical protein DI535_09205 [Citrobacter freundii]|nr:MAG: hypothetical protein DI535_09205 [Citrobacter freundii]